MLEQSTDTNNPSVHPNNEQSSNYASAETSLNPSLTSSLSSHSLRSSIVQNGDELIKSLVHNQPLSLVHDDDPSIVVSNRPLNHPHHQHHHHPLADLSGPVRVVPSSTSSNALDKLLKLSELHSEFQSLPPTFSSDKAGKPTESKDNVKTIIEKTILASINESVNSKENKEVQKPLIASGLFGGASSSLLTLTASSSSPNPECSPFKLLATELPSAPTTLTKSPSVSCSGKLETTRSPNGSTIHDAVALFNTESSKKTNDKIIESLASLNHKEHEKADPILSASGSKSSATQLTGSASVVGLSSIANPAPQTTNVPHHHLSPSKSTSALLSLVGVGSVPASSQEFCMGLNLNLAAAAAANAAAPIVVCDNTTKLVTSPKESAQTSPQNLLGEHQRFTSNASTSSIHNDLKMILEESKGQGSPKTGEEKSEDKKEAPKPQRDKTVKHKNLNNSKNSKYTKSKDSSLKSASEELTNMIKMMKLMSESKGKSSGDGGEQPVRFRYSKEFLYQIKQERSEFIANFKPEVFESYCYCMNGKYWDPEIYFDVIQFEGEDRSDQHNHSYNNSHKNKKNYHNNHNKYNNINNNNNNNNNNYNQKLKNLNRNNKTQESLNSSGKLTSTNSPSVTTGNKEDADRTLLNMLKKAPHKTGNGLANIMEMLNKKPANNILNELLKNEPQHHTPQIFTAQEVELADLRSSGSRFISNPAKTPDHRHNSTGPSSCSSSCSSSNSSNCDFSNSSEAYKQLIKNLSNHPLCTPPSSNRNSNFDEFVLKLSQTKTETTSIMAQLNVAAVAAAAAAANDGTNLIKQLLNLNKSDENEEKKTKKRHHHHKHGHHKSSSQHKTKYVESLPSSSSSKFPSVNPHEKPFQKYHHDHDQVKKQHVSPVSNQGNSTIENLILKMKQTPENRQKIEQEHLSSLLNKMTQHSAEKPTQKPDSGDILKWFSGLNMDNNSKQNFSAKTLTEVELMSGGFP